MPRLPLASQYSVLVIAGPTGVGKSEIAVEAANRLGGEIVGADAFQVYAGLRILTGQPGGALYRRAAHHLIGEVALKRPFDVAQYLAMAEQRLAQIRMRGRIPIVAGGTGLYVRALIRGLNDMPAIDPALRLRLEAAPLTELQQRIAELDPVAAASIDPKNARRLVRAIEVCLLTGRPFSSFQREWNSFPQRDCGILLARQRADLDARIDSRVEAMFREGVVEEVRNTPPESIGPTANQTLGLKQVRALLRGEITESACIANIQQATRQFARRQNTWFRKETGLRSVELSRSESWDIAVSALEKQRATEY